MAAFVEGGSPKPAWPHSPTQLSLGACNGSIYLTFTQGPHVKKHLKNDLKLFEICKNKCGNLKNHLNLLVPPCKAPFPGLSK